MKKLFTKLLLTTAIMLMGGANAWADKGDVTTNVDIDFSNAITTSSSSPKYSIAGTVGNMTWDNQWTVTPSIVDGILRFGNFTGDVKLVGDAPRNKDIVTISFDMAFGKLSNKHVGFILKDTDGGTILTQYFDAYNGDFDDNNPLNLNWASMFRGSNTVLQDRCVNFTIVINYEDNTIKTNTKCYLSGTGKAQTEADYSATLPSTKPLGSFHLTGNINNGDRYSTFDNLKITTTEGDYSSATADYKVQYKCDDIEIKDAEVRTGDVDANISLLSTDKEPIMNEGQKYLYVSDDANSNTVAGDGSTVVTVLFRKAAKYSYNVTTSYDGETLAYTVSGSTWEDVPNVTINYPRFQAAGATGNILVERTPVSNELKTTINVSEDNYTTDLAYTATSVDNLYLLSEAENLGTGLPTNGTSFIDRVSNRAIIFGASGTLLTLPAGIYKFTLGMIGGDNNTHQVNYVVNAGEETIIEATCTGNMLYCKTSDKFTLTEPTAITFTCSDPSSSRGIDLVYVQKITPENWTVSVPATVGMSTFTSIYNLDFSEASSIKAYTATSIAGESVKLTQVDVVPAGEGVILVAEGDAEENIPVVAEAAAIENNMLIGVLAATTVGQATDGGTNYVFAYNASNIAETAGFYSIGEGKSATVPAGKAYLHTPGSASVLALDFDEVTAIKAVEEAKTAEQGVAYSISGQRVKESYKGVVIKNGVKYLNK